MSEQKLTAEEWDELRDKASHELMKVTIWSGRKSREVADEVTKAMHGPRPDEPKQWWWRSPYGEWRDALLVGTQYTDQGAGMWACTVYATESERDAVAAELHTAAQKAGGAE